MKKFLSLFLAIVMCLSLFSLAGCGGKDDNLGTYTEDEVIGEVIENGNNNNGNGGGENQSQLHIHGEHNAQSGGQQNKGLDNLDKLGGNKVSDRHNIGGGALNNVAGGVFRMP